MDRVAEQAEMVEGERGDHLSGEQCCDHGGGAELRGQEDGGGHEVGAEGAAGPDPPRVAAGRGQGR